MIPVAVHFGRVTKLQAKHTQLMRPAYAANPARFTRRVPTPPEQPTVVGINLPKRLIQVQEIPHDITATPELFANFSTAVS